jgi:hypothetical protein
VVAAARVRDRGTGMDGPCPQLIPTVLTIDRSGALDVGLKRPDLRERAFVAGKALVDAGLVRSGLRHQLQW